MDESQDQLFDKLAELELLVSDIYLAFSNLFPEDSDFWWRLSIEETGHASIIRSGQQSFAPRNLFPEEFSTFPMRTLDDSLASKREMLKGIEGRPASFSRRKAMEMAMRIEGGDLESLFQTLMQKTPGESKALFLFQRLNNESRDHAERVRAYMDSLPLDVPCG